MMESTSGQSVKIMECAKKIVKNEMLKRLKEKIKANAVNKDQASSLPNSNKQLNVVDSMGNETISIPSIEVFQITGALPLETDETLKVTDINSVKIEPDYKQNLYEDHQQTETYLPKSDYFKIDSSIKEETVGDLEWTPDGKSKLEFHSSDTIDSFSFSVKNNAELMTSSEIMDRWYENTSPEENSTVQLTKSCNKCDFKCASYRDLRIHKIVFHNKKYPQTCKLCKYVTAKPNALEKHIKLIHEKLRYSCQQCEKTFDLKCRLIQHSKTHEAKPDLPEKEKIRYSCEQCDKTFVIKSRLITHVKSMHEGIRTQCSLCDYKCDGSGLLKSHIESVHEKLKRFFCNQCDFACYYSSKLKRHVRNVHEAPKSLDCKECDRKYKSVANLRLHVRVVHRKIKNFACDLCSYKTHQQADLNSHVTKVHNKIKAHLCETCGKSYGAIGYLKTHIEFFHSQAQPYSCFVCNKAFIRPDRLKVHMWNKHKVGEQPEDPKEPNYKTNKPQERKKCEHCLKTFSNKFVLRQHILAVHEKLKPHQCPHCEYAASAPENLREHVKTIHEKKHRHNCHICDFGCSSPFTLRQHIAKVHEKSTQKPYVCSICDFSTFYKFSLLQHDKLVHHRSGDPEVRKFPCKFCDLICTTSSHLRTHILAVHEKLRPHKCEKCGSSFALIGNLRTHIEVVHDKIHKFVCQSCDYTASNHGNLKKHIARYHKKSNPTGDIPISQDSTSVEEVNPNTISGE